MCLQDNTDNKPQQQSIAEYSHRGFASPLIVPSSGSGHFLPLLLRGCSGNPADKGISRQKGIYTSLVSLAFVVDFGAPIAFGHCLWPLPLAIAFTIAFTIALTIALALPLAIAFDRLQERERKLKASQSQVRGFQRYGDCPRGRHCPIACDTGGGAECLRFMKADNNTFRLSSSAIETGWLIIAYKRCL
jgi:hypothetical protein